MVAVMIGWILRGWGNSVEMGGWMGLKHLMSAFSSHSVVKLWLMHSFINPSTHSIKITVPLNGRNKYIVTFRSADYSSDLGFYSVLEISEKSKSIYELQKFLNILNLYKTFAIIRSKRSL